MKLHLPLALVVTGLLSAASIGADPTPTYQNNFEDAPVGKAPQGAMAIAGDFAVKEEGGNKFLELPGEPLDTFGILLGAAGQGDLNATAKFFGTKAGRKFPAFGVSLGGVGGYRLMMSGGKKALEIFKADEVVKSVPFEWASGEWTTLRLQVRKSGAGWVVEGKAWSSKAEEPKDWLIKEDLTAAPPAGRTGLWGSPYSGTLIRFDDLVVTPAS